MNTYPTKEKILDAAVELFCSRGYNNISVRDIADKVGIKAASLYNHFSSKREILFSIYDNFLAEQKKIVPDLDELLHLAETEAPHKVLMRMNYRFPPETYNKMEQALVIASREISFNNDSERFIREFLFEPTIKILTPLLKKMIELGKIEPLDIESFGLILTHFGFSSAVLSSTTMRGNEKNWTNGLALIFSMVKPIPDSADAPDSAGIFTEQTSGR